MISDVQVLILILSFGLISILPVSQILNVHAVQMTSSLVPTTGHGEVDWSAIRFLTIKYPPNSPLAQEFNGKSENVRFTMEANEDGMPQLVQAFNDAMASQKNSPVRISNASLTYTGQLRGTEDELSLSYNVALKPSFITGITLSSENRTADVVDLDWRSINVADPIILTTPYGDIDVNHPIGLLQANHSTIADQLMNTEASSIMADPLFNFQDIGRPMDTWHFLFDPTGSQAGAAGSGFEEIGGARVVSIYSLGESSFQRRDIPRNRKASQRYDGWHTDYSRIYFTSTVRSNDHQLASPRYKRPVIPSLLSSLKRPPQGLLQ